VRANCNTLQKNHLWYDETVMQRKFLLLVIVGVFSLGVFCAQGEKGKANENLMVTFETTRGSITCVLFEEQAPVTVKNFVALAEGTKEWIDPATGKKVKKPFYNGIIFHRVIPDFMIQCGDPLGTGTGGPGYKFKDEIVEKLKFDRPGRLAMANAGPDTNGSQFFITLAPTPWLNGKHTIFGQVIKGHDVVEKIAGVKRNYRDKPLKPVVLKKVIIKK
jgi:peptidyl-prolyl cis-trans isomerase A (cyclophilin A)